jgi:hypothetical protein
VYVEIRPTWDGSPVYRETRGTSHGFPVDKPYHLYEISKAPREVWPLLVAELVRAE